MFGWKKISALMDRLGGRMAFMPPEPMADAAPPAPKPLPPTPLEKLRAQLEAEGSRSGIAHELLKHAEAGNRDAIKGLAYGAKHGRYGMAQDRDLALELMAHSQTLVTVRRVVPRTPEPVATFMTAPKPNSFSRYFAGLGTAAALGLSGLFAQVANMPVEAKPADAPAAGAYQLCTPSAQCVHGVVTREIAPEATPAALTAPRALSPLEKMQSAIAGQQGDTSLAIEILANAKSGNMQAVKDLAYGAQNGRFGLAVDKPLARELFQMAAKAGNAQAIRDLNFLDGKATSPRTANAQPVNLAPIEQMAIAARGMATIDNAPATAAVMPQKAQTSASPVSVCDFATANGETKISCVDADGDIRPGQYVLIRNQDHPAGIEMKLGGNARPMPKTDFVTHAVQALMP